MTVLDTWPPGTCTVPKMRAYKTLEAKGILRIVSVVYSTTSGRLRITYETKRGINSADARTLLSEEANRIADICAENENG